MARLLINDKCYNFGTDREMWCEAAQIAASFKKCNEEVKIQIENDKGIVEDY